LNSLSIEITELGLSAVYDLWCEWICG